jgi:hypothetical protein
MGMAKDNAIDVTKSAYSPVWCTSSLTVPVYHPYTFAFYLYNSGTRQTLTHLHWVNITIDGINGRQQRKFLYYSKIN